MAQGGKTHAVTNDPNGKRGRPSSLSPDTIKVIVSAIHNLVSYEDAALLAGIHASTFQRWKAQGIADQKAGKTSDHRDFYEQLERANATARSLLAARVMVRSRTDPHLALKILERRDPKNWGLRTTVDVNDVTPSKKESPLDKLMNRLDRMADRQASAIAAGVALAHEAESDEDGVAGKKK